MHYPPWRSESRAWPWGFDLPRGYTYIHAPHNTRSAVRSRTYITIRREPSRVFPPAWQCHSHDCTVFSQGWRGWVFERKRGWLLRVRWPTVALFLQTRRGGPRTRSRHELALCETRDRIRAQLVFACFGYVTRVKRVSLSLLGQSRRSGTSYARTRCGYPRRRRRHRMPPPT